MQLFIDLGTNQLITDPLFKSPLPELSFKRGDSATVNLQFISGNTALSAVADKDIKFAIKTAGDYDGDPLVFTDEYTTSGVNYILKPSFNTTPLNALLSGDLPSVSGMLEIEVIQDGEIASSNTQSVTIFNDVIKNGELTPTVLPSPIEWLAQNSIVEGVPTNAFIFEGVTDFEGTLFPTPSASGYYYTSNGGTTVPSTGLFATVAFDSFENTYRLDRILDGDVDGTWYGGGSVAGVGPTNGTWINSGAVYADLDVTINELTTSELGNFYREPLEQFTDVSDRFLYVNLGTYELPVWYKFTGSLSI